MQRLCRAQTLYETSRERELLECEKKYKHKKKHRCSWYEGDEEGRIFDVVIKWEREKHHGSKS